MNSFRKLPDDTWGVQCDAKHEPGEVVTVTLRDGRTKTAKVGELFAVPRGRDVFVYRVQPEPKAPAESKSVGDLTGVLDLFAKAKAKLKFPAIVLAVTDPADADKPIEDRKVLVTLRLNVAGPQAKFPGSITVLSAEKGADDRRDWFGRILADGTFQPSGKLNGRTDAVVARLKEFAADPARVAAEHGRLTAVCSFCNHPLGGKDKDSPSGKRSLAVGYGKTCAGHYGLPW